MVVSSVVVKLKFISMVNRCGRCSSVNGGVSRNIGMICRLSRLYDVIYIFSCLLFIS